MLPCLRPLAHIQVSLQFLGLAVALLQTLLLIMSSKVFDFDSIEFMSLILHQDGCHFLFVFITLCLWL